MGFMGERGEARAGMVAAGRGPGRVVSLAQLPAGGSGVICESRLEAQEAALLRAMGLVPRARVTVCRLGEPCIVAVMGGCGGEGGGCRIGLARSLAARIFVTPTEAPGAPADSATSS